MLKISGYFIGKIWSIRLKKENTMALPTRPLGSSGLNITTVGLVPGRSEAEGGPLDGTARRFRFHRHHAARSRPGHQLIDTAAVYGLGHSEEVVGRLLRDLPASKTAVRVHKMRPDLG